MCMGYISLFFLRCFAVKVFQCRLPGNNSTTLQEFAPVSMHISCRLQVLLCHALLSIDQVSSVNNIDPVTSSHDQEALFSVAMQLMREVVLLERSHAVRQIEWLMSSLSEANKSIKLSVVKWKMHKCTSHTTTTNMAFVTIRWKIEHPQFMIKEQFP